MDANAECQLCAHGPALPGLRRHDRLQRRGAQKRAVGARRHAGQSQATVTRVAVWDCDPHECFLFFGGCADDGDHVAGDVLFCLLFTFPYNYIMLTSD